MKTRIDLTWDVGFSKDECISPEKRVPASVPGAVQLDWARAEGWGDYTYADNWKDYSWMEDMYWSYTTELEIPEISSGEKLFFICGGVDYRFKVKLNGEILHDQEGMFTPFEIDLTGRASKGDKLEVLVFPAPKSAAEPAGKRQADQCCKPAVSYGWDWHPRLIPLGIWEDTYLEVRSSGYICRSEVLYTLSDDLAKADINIDVGLVGSGTGLTDSEKIIWTLSDRNGVCVARDEALAHCGDITLSANLGKPELWWPNGHGDAVLYTSRVELIDKKGVILDSREAKVGFRTVRLVMHSGAWAHPDDFPKGRSNPPITMEINGRRIFCKGSNWVNPEIFPGIMTEDTYRPLVTLAREANMNLFRVWGGGIVNKEAFFNLCDEQGIMVWQEFPLACNNYKGTPHYLKILDQESKSIIKRLRPHASAVLWCGGNELFNSWSGMTDQSLALRLLNRNCYDLDPYTPFIMTSPVMGMAHGNYLFRYQNGEEVFQVMPRASYTAYTEFGCPGPSPAEYIKTFIPEEDLFPPKRGTAWHTHHAFDAWWPGSDTWLLPDVIKDYFGPFSNLEEMCERGELLQCEGYKCIFEEARRQKPKCSMALNWCYNEPWPTAANNSLINWPSKPKPAYYAVKAACRPVLASARIPKFAWQSDELFNPELWLLNDSPDDLAAGCIDAFLRIDGQEIFLLSWEYGIVPANTNLPGPVIRYMLPDAEPGRMVLVLRDSDEPGRSSEYTLLHKPSNSRKIDRSSGVTNI